MAAMLAAPTVALADGDPASDVLASQTVYVPGDGGFSAAQTARLSGLLAEAQRAGVPIRVALIATPADLGSVGELWGKPQSYAEFLGQELEQVYRGAVVVVMPKAIGIYHAPAGPPGSPLRSIGEGPGAAETGAAIVTAGAIALNAGHRLTLPRAPAARGSGSALGSVDLGSWLALTAGLALIALAWTASLRARGLGRLPGHGSRTSP
jgi:hypothetical protein